MSLTLVITASNVNIVPDNGKYISIEADGVEASDVLNCITESEAVEHYGARALLSKMTREEIESFIKDNF